MMKIDIKMHETADFMNAAVAEIEKQVTIKPRNAAVRHGRATVRFNRKPYGNIQTIEFNGSEAAIEATRAAISN